METASQRPPPYGSAGNRKWQFTALKVGFGGVHEVADETRAIAQFFQAPVQVLEQRFEQGGIQSLCKEASPGRAHGFRFCGKYMGQELGLAVALLGVIAGITGRKVLANGLIKFVYRMVDKFSPSHLVQQVLHGVPPETCISLVYRKR